MSIDAEEYLISAATESDFDWREYEDRIRREYKAKLLSTLVKLEHSGDLIASFDAAEVKRLLVRTADLVAAALWMPRSARRIQEQYYASSRQAAARFDVDIVFGREIIGAFCVLVVNSISRGPSVDFSVWYSVLSRLNPEIASGHYTDDLVKMYESFCFFGDDGMRTGLLMMLNETRSVAPAVLTLRAWLAAGART